MNNTETASTEAVKKSKRPTHVAYHVRDGADKGYWTRIGAAWANDDGKGFSLQLDVVPLDGRIVVRVPSESNS